MSQLEEVGTAGLAGSRAGTREWIGLAVLALPCILYAMDLTVLNLAVPQLSAALHPSATALLWIVDIYGFVLAGALIPMGALGDRIGRRRVLLYGAGFFGLASVLAAFSSSVAMLIAARALLGLAAATLAPSTLSLIRNMFLDPAQRTFAIGVWISSFSVGGALGPVIGGILLEYYWWGSVFLLNVPIMLLLLAIGPLLLPEFRDPSARPADLASAGLLLVAVLLVIYAIKQSAGGGDLPLAAALVAGGLLLVLLFVRRQRRIAEPFLDLALFRLPAFNAAIGVNVLACFTAIGSFLVVAQYMQLVLGLSPLQAGLWMLPSGLAFTLGSLTTPLLLRRLSPVSVMVLGLLLTALGFAVLLAGVGLWFVAVAITLFSLGLAPVFTLTTDTIVSAAPAERAGAASAISETSAEFGGALGIAVLGSLATAVYRLEMQASALPVSAQETLTATLARAAAAPADQHQSLARAAALSYTQSLQAVAAACVAASLLAACATALLLRGVKVAR